MILRKRRCMSMIGHLTGFSGEEGTAVLASIGLTPSSAYVLLMTKIAADKVEAMKAARRGELISVPSVADLFTDIDDDDDDSD